MEFIFEPPDFKKSSLIDEMQPSGCLYIPDDQPPPLVPV
jgi:hypothetical protein